MDLDELQLLEAQWARDTWPEDEAKERELGLAGS